MCRNAQPKTTQILLTARQTIQPAEPYAAKQSPTLHQEQNLGFALGGRSGPKGPVTALPIFGEGFGGPAASSREGLGALPPQVVRG